jgi:hypothetical protein
MEGQRMMSWSVPTIRVPVFLGLLIAAYARDRAYS